MRRLVTSAFVFAAVLAAGRPAAALPTAEELLARLAKAAPDVKTWSHDVRVTWSTEEGKTVAAGACAGATVVRDGKPARLYSSLLAVARTDADGEGVTGEYREVCDGTYYWEESKGFDPGTVEVSKHRADSKDEAGAPRAMDPLTELAFMIKEMYALRVTGEDTLNGEKVYRLEGRIREGYLEKNPDAEALRGPMVTVRIAVGQKDLVPRSTRYASNDGHETVTVEVTKVKLNGEADEKLFRYTPPEGAEITDETGEVE